MVVSSGGGLGRVRLTLRSSELCCRAASWRETERKGGWESRRIWGDKDAWTEKDYRSNEKKTRAEGRIEQ